MTELEQLLDKARQLAEARNHRLLPFVRRGSSAGSRCVTCGRQVYVMPDPGLIGAAIGGDAIAEMCIRKPSVSVKAVVPKRKGWKLFCPLPKAGFHIFVSISNRVWV